MDFALTPEQLQLRSTVRQWVTTAYPFEQRQRIVRAGGYSAQAWQGLAALGLTGLTVSTEQGGQGLGPVEAMVVMEELGRGLVLEPFAAVALVATSLFTVTEEPDAALWLAGVSSGRERVVLAHQEREARYRLAQVQTRATCTEGNWQLTGRKTQVPAAAHMGAFIVPARVHGAVDDPAGVALFLVSRGEAGISLRHHATPEGACAAELVLTNAEAIELMPAGSAFAALEWALDVGLAALCAEAVGVMDKLFELTVAQLQTRHQFGAALASFQALRHRVADVKMQLELARSMSYYATLKLGAAPAPRRLALSQAKLQLGQSMRLVGQQCLQLHGGLGLTDECLASHCFKRLSVMELCYGDSQHHLSEVSARLSF